MHSNLPPGTANDPNAPWNTKEFYCRSCDSRAIAEVVDQYLADNPNCNDWDEAYEEFDNEGNIGLCRECYWEEMGEYGDD
jgi:hypothetical protein